MITNLLGKTSKECSFLLHAQLVSLSLDFLSTKGIFKSNFLVIFYLLLIYYKQQMKGNKFAWQWLQIYLKPTWDAMDFGVDIKSACYMEHNDNI